MTSLPGNFTPAYDNNGNVTNDSFHAYTWDADSHPITVDNVSLTYDALGRMAEQARGTSYTQVAYSPTGQKLALMTSQTLQKAMLPLIGGAQAVYNSSGLLYYAHPDLLGSIRLATTPTTRAMYFDTAYAPFGETYASSGTLDPAYTGKMNDTAQRQDTAGGLYDFPVREYSTQGRWPSPDPAGVSATCTKNPQTQNRYAYVTNNPLSYVDPLGTQGRGRCFGDSCGGCDPFLDPFCFGGCDPFFDPFCFPGPIGGGGGGDGRGGGGGGFGGGGGNPEKPRPFPWPQLPLGFFNALQVSPSDAEFCAKQFIECFKGAMARAATREAKINTPESCWQHCAEQYPPSNPIASYFFWPCYYGCIGKAALAQAASETRLGIELLGCKLQHTACMKGRKSPRTDPTL